MQKYMKPRHNGCIFFVATYPLALPEEEEEANRDFLAGGPSAVSSPSRAAKPRFALLEHREKSEKGY